MVRNVSYNNKDIIKEIDLAVGKSYSWRERLKLKGIGSPKLWVTKASKEIHDLLHETSYNKTCNIELRPKGIIISFRSRLETYAFVIPYHFLKIYKSGDEMTFYHGDQLIGIRYTEPKTIKFMNRLMNLRLEVLEQSKIP